MNLKITDASFRFRAGAQRMDDVKVENAITINRPCSEIYSTWQQLENPLVFMPYMRSFPKHENLQSRVGAASNSLNHL
jgi:uncharacterized membrane protein